MHDRAVLLQLTDGVVYEGVFNTLKVHGKGFHVVLKYAKVVKDPTLTADGLQALAQKPEPIKTLPASSVVSVFAKDVKMGADDLGPEQDDFETDSTISRGRGG